jgi:polyhydroxyalkanoate synthase subunit PhaC
MQCDFLDLSYNNQIVKKEKRILGKRIDFCRVTYPVYLMAGSTDHITPWKACYRSTQMFGGPVTFVLTNQNHTQTISGRLDNKHLRYWIPRELPEDPDAAMATAAEHKGSWTFHWIDWLQSRYEATIPAPKALGSKKYPPLYPAPGQYVLES